ncbi:MAG: DUF2383 domain-containing protein, partial [Planctomycetota bacterium]
ALAAERVTNSELCRMFERFGFERQQFAEQLGRKLENAAPPHDGTLLGGAHRGWMNLVGHASTTVVLTECVRGENASIRHYESMLERGLPDDVKVLVREQLDYIVEARDRLAEIAAQASMD